MRVSTANFYPTNMTVQMVTLFINYPDDMIALEPDMIFNYNLTNVSSDVRIGTPRTVRHVIVDDDRKNRGRERGGREGDREREKERDG